MEKIKEFIANNTTLILIVVAVLVLLILALIIFSIVHKNKKSASGETAEPNESDIPMQEASEEEKKIYESETVNEARLHDNAELSWLKDGMENENTEQDEVTLTKLENGQTASSTDKESRSKKEMKDSVKKQRINKKSTDKSINTEEKQKRQVSGKWVIKEKGDSEYVAYLYANNGEIMLTSEIYSTADGARSGVETIKKNMQKENFLVYCDKNANHYFKLKNQKNRFLCVGETYTTRESCENAILSVLRFASANVVDGVEKDLTLIKYVPSNEETTTKSGYSGKWKIEEIDGMYMAKLYASNGELLLNSESYVAYSSARSAIDTITTNGINGNFIIDSDKKGRYFFKLRNAQKSTLCVGETYAQLSTCQSAIDSVRRFLKTAKIVEDKNTVPSEK